MHSEKTQGKQRRPLVWLGQSVDTSSLCSAYEELRRAPILTSLGCAIRRPSLQRTHFTNSLRDKLGLLGPLMLDSGGFALSTNANSDWSVDIVGSLIERINADVSVALDIPPGLQDAPQLRRKKIRTSMRNFTTLYERFPNKTIMPVVHGRNVSEVELSIQLVLQCASNPKWVGLGGMVPLLKKRRTLGLKETPEIFIAQAIALLRQAFPNTRIHVFGAGGTRTFPAVYALGADSADSIGWRQAAGYGSIFLPMKSQRTVKWNSEKRPPRRVLDRADLLEIEACKCPVCHGRSIQQRIAAFKRHFHTRSIHNAWTTIHQWESWPRSRSKLAQVIHQGALGSGWAKAIGHAF